MTSVEKIEYGGWPNCYRVSNGKIDLVITTDVGPRVIRLGFENDGNELKEFREHLGIVGGDEWRLYGGHRLWHAPENDPRTLYPDNAPVKLEEHSSFVRTIQETEPTTGVEKQMDFYMDDDSAHVKVIHRLINHNLWAIEFAPWALTVMTTGGTVIVPQPVRGSHEENLLPTHSLTAWAYTDLSDPRWTWGERFILLRQDVNAGKPQKIGVSVREGWGAYARKGHLFVKTFGYIEGATYPDWGCSLETFTNDEMIELESLGPMMIVQPNEAVEHVEDWYLFDGVAVPRNDADVDREVMPKIRSIL